MEASEPGGCPMEDIKEKFVSQSLCESVFKNRILSGSEKCLPPKFKDLLAARRSLNLGGRPCCNHLMQILKPFTPNHGQRTRTSVSLI